MNQDEQTIGEQLAGWGKVALLRTRGRRTGQPLTTAVGFVEDAEGALLVAAGSPDADWVLNLQSDRACQVTIADRTAAYRAVSINDPAERARAVTALIIKYGTPAERLGRGPVFRLLPDSRAE